LKTEDNFVSLVQSQGMSAKMAANEIRTHARTNQWRTLVVCRLRTSL